MKKLYILLGLIIMSTFSLGGVGSILIASAQESVYNLYEYRPLIPGSSWTYNAQGFSGGGQETGEKVTKEEDLDGISVKVIKHAAGWTDYFEEAEEGVKRHKHLSSDGKECGVYYPPAIQYPKNMKVGEIHKRERVLKNFSSADDKQIGEDTEIYTFQLIGVEDVKVPYGEFTDCLKTLAEWQTYNEEGKQYFNKGLLTWDAKGVGELLSNVVDEHPFKLRLNAH